MDKEGRRVHKCWALGYLGYVGDTTLQLGRGSRAVPKVL